MNFKNICIIGILVISLLITGCESPSEQVVPPEKISITGILHTGSTDPQVISVYKTSPLGDKNAKDNFITDASVFITDSIEYSSRYILFEDALYGKGYKNPDKTDFKPGRRYFIKVETPSGTAFGETRFPDDFEITSHKNNDIIQVMEDVATSIDVRWTKSIGSHGYFVTMSTTSTIERTDGTRFENQNKKYLDVVDNFCSIPVYMSTYGIGKLIKCEGKVTVMAYDHNFRTHHYESQNISGLKGAYGYFASATEKTIHLIIK